MLVFWYTLQILQVPECSSALSLFANVLLSGVRSWNELILAYVIFFQQRSLTNNITIQSVQGQDGHEMDPLVQIYELFLFYSEYCMLSLV